MIKFFGKLTVTSLMIAWGLAVSAQTPDITVKVIGVSYFEAPPNREKNLAYFWAGSSMEIVEAHAVATSTNRHFTEFSSALEKHDITATAILPDKTRLPLGQAEMGNFPKLSTDARARLINLKVNRLPDQPILGVIFEGTLPVQMAKGFATKSAKFEPRAGTTFALGDIKVGVGKVEGQIITLTGDTGLTRLRSLALRQADGRTVSAERHGYSIMGSAVELAWKFASAPSAGTLEAEIYQPFESASIPIRFVVGKPF